MATTDPELINFSASYEVHIQSDGSKGAHWPEGVWFQASPFMHSFASYAEAEAAVRNYITERGEFSRLPMRVMLIQSTAVVVSTLN